MNYFNLLNQNMLIVGLYMVIILECEYAWYCIQVFIKYKYLKLKFEIVKIVTI